MLRKNADMTEIGGLQQKGDSSQSAVPALAHFRTAECPTTAVFTGERGIRTIPDIIRKGRAPDCLSTGTAQDILPETFQFPAIAGIKKLITNITIPELEVLANKVVNMTTATEIEDYLKKELAELI